MAVPDFALTSEETALYEKISFDWKGLDHAAFVKNGDAVAALMKSLLARKAIPDIRMKYFTDPAYRSGRIKGSHHDLFRRSRNTDEEMMRHAQFLDYIDYFLHGPKLPADALRAFRDEVGRCAGVTSSDALPLARFARQETRKRGLAPHKAAEEYFKLALECGMWVSYAFLVRDKVKTIR
jgi:hypothetical protein